MMSARQGDCLDDETAARFAGGGAAPDEVATIEAHLDACATCRRTVAALAAGSPPLLHSFVHADHLQTEPVAVAGGASDTPALGERIGRFVTLGALGRGGMGIVVAAHDPELDRRVAIKLVHPALWRSASRQARELLRAEARAMARLVHPNVVAVHDLGTVGDQLFVAMELVEGASLDGWRRAAPRAWRDILAVCVQAGRGIAAAHRAGLVHRDVKPQNVLVDRAGHARITDFGLAALVHAGPDLAEAGPAGTPAYMSPEQHRMGEVGPASDQFSFCVMLYEALFDIRPFGGATPAAVAVEVLAGRVRDQPRRPRIPGRIRRALRRGLSIDPADRFPDMDALLAALAIAPRWRRFAIVPAVAAAAIAGALLARGGSTDADEVALRRARAEAAAVWNDDRRAAVATAIAATGVGHAEVTTRRVDLALDAHLARWTEARVEVAARNRSGQDPVAVASRRAGCLDRRLGEVEAVVDVLAGADRGVADHALDVTAALTPIAVCLAPRAPDDLAPEEPGRRARHDDLQALLHHAVASHSAGKDAIADLEAVVGAARDLAHPPLTAEALYQLGRVLSRRDRNQAAEAVLDEALAAAAHAGSDRVVARVWIERTMVAASLGHAEAAHERAFAAEVEIERGGARDLRLELLEALAFEAEMAGRLDDAEAHARQGLALTRQLAGSEPLELARAMRALGSALAALHRHREALPFLHAALVLAEGELGADHPGLATYLIALVEAHHELGRLDGARAFVEHALAVAPPDLRTPRVMLAAMIEFDDPARAEALSREVADDEAASPADRFSALLNLGVLQHRRQDFAAAAATLDRLLALGETFYDPRLAHALALRGAVAIWADDDRAAGWCRDADALVVARFGRDEPSRALPLACLAQATRRRGDFAGALAAAAEAFRVAELGNNLDDQVNARRELAWALWLSGQGDRARAVLDEGIARTRGVHQDFLRQSRRKMR